MPIQFRCGACNQLLGIASRKGGAVVVCPTCGGKTIVPRPRKGAEADSAKGRPDFSLLERIDVDKLLGPPAPGKMATPRPASKAAMAAAPSVTISSSSSGHAHEPKELRALTESVLPGDVPQATSQVEDEDDLPQPLDETLVNAVLILTKRRLASLAVGVVLLLVAAFALGFWLGGRG